MEIDFMKSDRQELKVKIGSLTLVELLRVYLNENPAVKFAAWRREHPTKPPVLHIKTQKTTAKKALQDAISKIEKDTGKFLAEFKKEK